MKNRSPLSAWSGFLLLAAVLIIILPSRALADTNCEEGNSPLNSAQPQGVTAQDIIQKFAAKEEIFREARNHYTYTQEIVVQELDGDTVDGEFRETTDILYDDQGKRLEEVKFAPQPTLKRIIMSQADFDDFRNRLPFVLTTSDLGQYNILYAGQQGVDELQTYVFDIAPKRIEKDKRYFQGRIWVDNRDFQIVKTCGKNVPDVHKKNNENLTPKFVTYREQVDGEYWFPTYTKADDTLEFSTGGVHVREIVKYTNYKKFGVKTRITFKGQVPDQPNNQQNPPK